MPDLRDNVFLSSDMAEVTAQLRSSHSKTFSLAERLNELAHREMFATEVASSNAQHLLIACLLHRALTTFQGLVVLTERGMPAEATTLLRTLLEVMFRIVAIAKDPEVGKAYILQDEFHRKKFINKFKLLSESVRSAAGGALCDHESLLADINTRIDAYEINERSTLWFAEQAGLADFYHSAYSVFSGAVHANVRDIESALVVDTEGNVTAFNYGPTDAGIDEIILTAIESLIFCLRSTFSVLPGSLKNEFDYIAAEFNTLHQEIFAKAKT